MQGTAKLSVEHVEARLSELIGRDKVTVDPVLSVQLFGHRQPLVKVVPESEEEAASVLQMTSEYDLTVAPGGALTQMGMGNVPAPIDVVLSTERLNQVLEYSPADMVVSAQAGVSLVQLQAVLRDHGQFLPLDPVLSADATLGGLVATAVSGPLRTLYGSVRDLTIGLRTLYPDGRLVKAGGKVVKNVAGYDMTKLFIGSLGTLAFFSEVAFKLRPLPQHTELCLLSGSAEQVSQLSHRVIHSHLIASRMEALSGALTELHQPHRPWVVAMESHENETAATYQTQQLTLWARDLGMDLDVLRGPESQQFWQAYQSLLLLSEVSFRFIVPPNKMAEVVERLRLKADGLAAQTRISAGALTGIARVFLAGGTLEEHEQLIRWGRDLVAPYGGSAVVEKAPVLLRQRVESFGPVGSDFALMQSIKAKIDPDRRLSPGRFVGGI